MNIGNKQVQKRYIGTREVLKAYIGEQLVYSGIDPLIAAAQAAGAKLYLDARKATGTGLPTNTPLTTPWVDLSGNSNNATPTNFASTTASGVDVSDPLKPVWVLEGSDDCFNIIASLSLNITNAPLAIFATLKITTGASAGWILSKNVVGAADMQYGLYYNSAQFQAYLEGASRVSVNISQNIYYNVGFIWDGTNVKVYFNGVQNGAQQAFSGTLTNRSDMAIGKRANNAVFFKGRIATVTIYSGVNAVESKILAAEQLISAAYL